jgi:hypothetical protein
LDERSFSSVVWILRDARDESFSASLFASLRLCGKYSYNDMVLKKLTGLLVVLLLVISVSAKIQKMRRIAIGSWGGQHISMNVTAKSATIEYDCATGVINGPLVVDADGNFNLHGTHRMERGGPVRADEKPSGEPATYTGTIKGNTMTLTLKVGDSDEETFTLEKGQQGELVKCK